MGINVNELLSSMADAAKMVFKEDWPAIKDHANTELKGIAQSISMIEKLYTKGKMTESQAKALIQMKKNTAQIILLTIEGMGAAMVQRAINAAMKSIKDTVNTALDFALL